MSSAKDQYTVAQHSAYGVKGDTTFEAGLESQAVTAAEARKVEKAGGVLFPGYTEAEAFALKAQYPQGYDGLVPMAQGTFSSLHVGGLAVYVPVREVVG
ncbi:hypothetical protein [Kineococcus radiotolerans]|uniref:Uncharacterized protein n=1 Tax=Kineococcus radiotolerans (strain ATCC BAA-149 / DSM 14245 / SRS30216) TaxID=266940 RepID=A6WH62_KINRD|nr:hypothetical protein [Kineococcus radiotolerans]ABS06151.1 hypothetical protein Krad_4693 [Kineococcus radiotolerans SRS30216 = ATCC BAA-149]